MFSQFRLKRLVPAAAAMVILLSVACGDGEPAAEIDNAEVPQAPSLALPSPGAITSALDDASGPDFPEFPEVTPAERTLEMPPEVPEELKIIWEAWQFLAQDYVDRSKLDPEASSEGAIRGMLRALGDPEMSYVSPEVMKGVFQDVFRGNFEGIGAYVQMNAAGKLVIVSPIEGGPAEAAGIRPGDIVLEVDGESLEGLGVLEAVAKIRGPRGGLPVKLLVKHLGAIDPVVIEIIRGRIPLTSVLLRSEPGDRLMHVRITNFYPNTVDQLKEVILKAVSEGAEGLILDLRDNPGGTLDAVVDVASQFLDDGLVLYDVDGNGRRNEWRVRAGGVATDIPMVVLVNAGSASSSEVLVGALQDHKRAKVIGVSTYGKGSVNILRQLSNGGGLYITIAHWYTPLGRLIQEEGLEPDVEVEDRDRTEADVKQLKRAIQELEELVEARQSANLSS